MRSGIFLLVVVLALAALAALLWWRFRGGGPAAAPAVTATRNHHSLRTLHYGRAGTDPATCVAAEAAEAGTALDRLLPAEDLVTPPPPPRSVDEATAPATVEGSVPATAEPADEAAATAADQAPRPASSRHAAGAVASLLDALDELPRPATEAPPPEAEPGEEPAAALFHNPLTAPAPTANDQANRAAEIALRQQRRARMSADAAAQRAALSGLFPGAGSPAPPAPPA